MENSSLDKYNVRTLQARIFMHPNLALEAETLSFECSSPKQKEKYQLAIENEAHTIYATLLTESSIAWTSLQDGSPSARTNEIYKNKLEELKNESEIIEPATALKIIPKAGSDAETSSLENNLLSNETKLPKFNK